MRFFGTVKLGTVRICGLHMRYMASNSVLDTLSIIVNKALRELLASVSEIPDN